jgi:hypothetical protein
MVSWRALGNEESASKPVEGLRPLKLSDFRDALKEVAASVSEESATLRELREWNEIYGVGGSRKAAKLSYFI